MSRPRKPISCKNNKILVLDPDETIQMLFQDELREEGYEVIPVTDPSHVLRDIRVQQLSVI